MNFTEEYYVHWLSCVKGIGCKKAEKLVEYFGKFEHIYRADVKELQKVSGIRECDVRMIDLSRKMMDIEKSYERLKAAGVHLTYRGKSTYPDRLISIYNAPYWLYYKGKLPDDDRPCVAVVGSRNASFGGIQTAKNMGRELAENGIQVISGLARGIDISSQKGALSITGGMTYGVMGCGIDICYPAEHIEEYMLMQENGGIISEYPMGVKAAPYYFPMRNRIISGLSDGILVIEAKKKSGSLITAELGIEQGKDIFVVPGGIGDILYEGGNNLIKSGAALVTEVSDILDALGIIQDENITQKKKKNNVVLETSEKIVYASLSLEPVHISQIASKTGFSIPDTMEIIVGLELKDVIYMVGSNYYAIK